MATASLILGLISCVTILLLIAFAFADLSRGYCLGVVGPGFLCGLLAVIAGHRAKARIRRSGGTVLGEDRAVPGLAFGYLGLGVSVLPLLGITFEYYLIYQLAVVGNPIRALRTINTAAATYADRYKRGYPPTLEALGPPTTDSFHKSPQPDEKAAGLIDQRLASGSLPGHAIKYVAGPADSDGRVKTYSIHIGGVAPFGDLYYFTDQTGVIRKEQDKEADANSPPIPE
jgi:hypothetical protein